MLNPRPTSALRTATTLGDAIGIRCALDLGGTEDPATLRAALVTLCDLLADLRAAIEALEDDIENLRDEVEQRDEIIEALREEDSDDDAPVPPGATNLGPTGGCNT
jgi:chromosome segregation ATPase